MQVWLKQLEGLALAGTADSHHWVVMDTDEEVGGLNAASKPLELVLMGLGGCTGMDVLSILKKMRINPERFEMVLNADRAEEHPKVFTRVRVEYQVFGENIDPENVERAISLSRTKYCAVSAMLSKAVPIEFSYRINPKSNEKQ